MRKGKDPSFCAAGLLREHTVECPKHSSIIPLETGEVESPPACNNLRTHRAIAESGRILAKV